MKRVLVSLAVLIVLLVMSMFAPDTTSAIEPTPLYITAVDRLCESGELSVLCSPVATPVAIAGRSSVAWAGNKISPARVELAYQKFCRVLWITWRVSCP